MSLLRSVPAMTFVLLASAASALATLPACGGRSIGDDLTSTPDPTIPVTPNDAGPDAPVVCNGPNLACDPGDDSVGSEANCGAADDCYSRTGCTGSVLWCAHHAVAQCGAVPRCDNGDREVGACPGGSPNSGFNCYPRTLCGSTILCVHQDACTSLPQCDPGDKEVTDINTCTMKGVSCYPVTACNYTIHCYTP